ncbi:FMN-dependent NADH-azoreductase [Pleurocapsa sp. CCALA 161]|uniref:FMN-dependent NADH-azoreductase n=1 Tax=Pleurocapsa sp. CCALA 161 TaxID=2107688 RepID=UPI000D05F82D|nr:FMN-dependent NADH-azoreductase [Pleurocapsa sp. CCALA 161]PSB10089.1 FMN-dependent NADH-azoreductase [Pleurocapsa sp. CCALA 161]
MTCILHLDSSPRGDRSLSRGLTSEFNRTWQQTYPEDKIIYRDLGHNPVPFVDESWIAAAFSQAGQLTPELKSAIEISDRLIDEFLAAKICVFGIPMYNYGVPANFKAYIDQIVRVGRTFAVTSSGYEGLVKEPKKILVITTRGGSYKDSPLDFQEPYLRAVFELIGIADLTFIHAENLAMGDEARQKSLAEARTAIQQFIEIC